VPRPRAPKSAGSKKAPTVGRRRSARTAKRPRLPSRLLMLLSGLDVAGVAAAVAVVSVVVAAVTDDVAVVHDVVAVVTHDVAVVSGAVAVLAAGVAIATAVVPAYK